MQPIFSREPRKQNAIAPTLAAPQLLYGRSLPAGRVNRSLPTSPFNPIATVGYLEPAAVQPLGSLVPPVAPPGNPTDNVLPTPRAPPTLNGLRPPSLLLPPGEAESIDRPLGNRPTDAFGASGSTTVLNPLFAPLGFAGRSSVVPTEAPASLHFAPVEDRWRAGLPRWDRYGEDHSVFPEGDPFEEDSPYVVGSIRNPYNQNVLKGDYPIRGQHTFLDITAESLAILETRQVPTPTTPFESTFDPFAPSFFGNPNQFFYNHNFKLSFDLFHGDAAFKPADWRVKITPVFNLNYLDVEELGVVNPDVRRGTTRARNYFSLQEWFVETKLRDDSPYYDFTSVRAGSQFFVSDFRGFIFSDVNRSVRLFGSRRSNRDQFNVIWFDQTEKDTNSGLNRFDDRHQNTVIANYYRQDFIWPGYTSQLSFHWNRDQPSFLFNRNDFLVRPDPVGVFRPHRVESYYFGWTGDGHINRINIDHAFYWVVGRDSLNPIAGRPVNIDAKMFALELSYDRDWVRFRTSLLWFSGDNNALDGKGKGFDAIFDNPNFAGGEFSFWQRQTIQLLGVNLVNRNSLTPNLRSSVIQGQTNFVNPGLLLINAGFDVEITPRMRTIANVNFLWFDKTEVLEQFVFQSDIDHFIGTDLSLGLEYRPLLNDNLVLIGGVSSLLPGIGFDDLFSDLNDPPNAMFASFLEMVALY